MEIKNLATGMIGLVVAVVVVIAMLVPVVSESSYVIESKENDSYQYLVSRELTDATYTVTDGDLFINGEEMTQYNSTSYNHVFGLWGKSGMVHLDGGEYIVWTGSEAQRVYASSVEYTSDGSYTIVTNAQTYTGAVEEGEVFAPSNDGVWGAYSHNSTFMATEGTTLYCAVPSFYTMTIDGSTYNFHALFTLVDGVMEVEYCEYFDGSSWVDMSDKSVATYVGAATTEDGVTTYVGTGCTLTVEGATTNIGTLNSAIYAPLSYS